MCNLVHRDIKDANILIKNKLYKIADFGLSQIVDKKKKQKMQGGSFFYTAPEL